MFQGRCPLCGTAGRTWSREPDVFICPNCMSVYSNFGLVIESDKEPLSIWN